MCAHPSHPCAEMLSCGAQLRLGCQGAPQQKGRRNLCLLASGLGLHHSYIWGTFFLRSGSEKNKMTWLQGVPLVAAGVPQLLGL